MTRPLHLALLALGLTLVGGCADAVDPTLGTEQAFSLYGYLDPTADRQAVRVVPIAETLAADTARTLDVDVTSLEPATGRTATWRDSVVTYEDGSRGHIFVADYTPTAGATVEVRVAERSGAQRAATVSVGVPALARPTLGLTDVSGGEVTYPLRLEAPRVLAAELVYYVVGLPEAPADTAALVFSDPPALEPDGAGRWALDLLFLQTTRAFLREAAPATPLKLVEVEFRAFVANEAWAVPARGFDLDDIVEPGTFSNVDGGFGFVGAGFRTSVRWTPSLTTQSRAGFAVEDDPASALVINEVSAAGWAELFNPTADAISIGGYVLAEEGQQVEIPFGTLVAPGGFEVVTLPGPLTTTQVDLLAPNGELAVTLELVTLPEADLGTYGSFPDGRSRPIGELPTWRGYDLFRGGMTPTPGRANQLVPLAVVNEVFSAGTAGWAEVVTLDGIAQVLVTDDPERPIPEWPAVPVTDRRAVADEGERLALPQLGGEVLVVVFLLDTPPRVYDARTYGPQTPKRSAGLIPDGDRTGWQDGLLPTRGAPNALARLGL